MYCDDLCRRLLYIRWKFSYVHADLDKYMKTDKSADGSVATVGGCALGNSCIISSAGTWEGCCSSYVKNFPLHIDAGGLAKMHMLTSRTFSRADVSTCNGPVAPCANANQPVVSPTIAW